MDKDKVLNWLDTTISSIPIKGVKPTIILYKGNKIRLQNGKEVWLNKRSAKGAFSNSINHLLNKTSSSKIRQQLEDEGLLEFKEL